MKSADAFWDSIQRYNEGTLLAQLLLMLAIFICLHAAYKRGAHWMPRALIALLNIYTAIVFFMVYDRSAMGLFFAAPLFMLVGTSCAIDAFRFRNEAFGPFSGASLLWIGLLSIYPILSLSLGHIFPKQVLYILPCPVMCISILLYSRYSRKSLLTLIPMAIWALTGIKAIVFDVYEDLILFAFAFYAIYQIAATRRRAAKAPREGPAREEESS